MDIAAIQVDGIDSVEVLQSSCLCDGDFVASLCAGFHFESDAVFHGIVEAEHDIGVDDVGLFEEGDEFLEGLIEDQPFSHGGGASDHGSVKPV